MGNISRLLQELPELLETERIGIVVSGDPLPVQSVPHDSKPISGTGNAGDSRRWFITAAGCGVRADHGAGRDSQHPRTGMQSGDDCLCRVGTRLRHFLLFRDAGHGKLPSRFWHMAGGYGDLCRRRSDLSHPAALARHAGTGGTASESETLLVAAVRNPHPKPTARLGLLPDSAFLRNRSPMTKEEVRAVVLSKLRLKPDAVVWDLGAGTGSVSIECARMCPFGTVYAVEYKPAALEILEKNKAFLQTENLQIIPGRAEEQIGSLPVPDCVFLGGSDGAAPD